MKINKLTIHNIASIIDATIDFTTYPLADESIFLITGNTGSGKTTVLNAICIALYDKVPSLIGAPNEKDPEGVSIDSAMQLARRDVADCASVALQYEGKDRKQYEITWVLERYSKGKKKGEFKSRPERTLSVLDKDGRPEYSHTSVGEINKLVEKTVDLTFDQFCRTTMLAQGQFLKFMESNENEKCKILEKLTGTEIYKRIGEEVNALYKGSEAEYAEFSRRLEGITSQLLSGDELQQTQEKIGMLALETKTLQSMEDEARKEIGWLETRGRLSDALEKARQRLAKAQARDVEPQRRMLKAWDDTVAIREILKRKKQLADELNTIERQSERLGEAAAEACAALAALKRLQSECLRTAAENDAKLAACEPSKGMYANYDKIRIHANEICADMAQAADSDAKAMNLQKELDKSLLSLREKEREAGEAKDRLDAAQRNHASLESIKAKFDIKGINDRKNALNNRKAVLTALARALSIFVEKTDDLEKSRRDLEEKEQELALLQVAQPEKQKECEDAKTVYKALNAKLQGQMDLKDKLAELKIIFHDEKKCPLCGSADGHIAAESVINQAIDDARVQADTVRAALDMAEDALKENTIAISRLKKEVERAGKDYDESKQLQSKASEQLGKAKSLAESPDASDLDSWIDQQLADAEAKLADCDREYAAATEAINRCDESQTKLNGLRSECERLVGQMDKIRIKSEKDKAQIEKHREISESKRLHAAGQASQLSELLPQGEPLLKALGPKPLAEEIKTHLKRIEIGKQLYDNLIEEKKHISEQAQSLQDRVGDIERTLDAMPDVRPSEKNIAKASVDVKAVDSMCRSLEKTYHSITALRADNASKTVEAEAQQADYFEKHGKNETLEKLDVLVGNPSESEAAEWRREVQEYDSELKTSIEFVESGAKALGEHDLSKPAGIADADTIANINGRLQEMDIKLKSCIEEHTRLDAAVKRNDELKSSVEKDLPRLKALETEYLEWKEIDAMFGTTKSRNEFGVIAQRFIFNQLLERANEYLRQLNPRYSLKCRLDSMQIYVVDHYLGDSERVANGLSGGEGFIASLSLALALSSINTDRESVDTIFIDEGFGTLSSELLQTVIEMLDRLQCGLGRRVGIISHIDFLKERIHTKICLDPMPGKSASAVTISTQ